MQDSSKDFEDLMREEVEMLKSMNSKILAELKHVYEKIDRRDHLITSLLLRVDRLEKLKARPFSQEINPTPEYRVTVKTGRHGG